MHLQQSAAPPANQRLQVRAPPDRSHIEVAERHLALFVCGDTYDLRPGMTQGILLHNQLGAA